MLRTPPGSGSKPRPLAARFGVGLIGVLALLGVGLGFAAPSVQAADVPVMISGRVLSTNGAIVSTTVGLFQANADGSRGAWVKDTTTFASTGSYLFDTLPAGCYLVTFVAPPGMVFNNDLPFRTAVPQICLAAGESIQDVNATLVNGNGASISGTVFAPGSTTLPAVSVSLLQSDISANLGRWDHDVAVAADGTYQFTNLASGCYVLVFIAPVGRQWTYNSDRYFNQHACVVAGEQQVAPSMYLAMIAGTAAMQGAVDNTDGLRVAGVQVDLFAANPDRSRAAWVASTTTSTTGDYVFGDLTGDCYVLTFIAPAGRTFINSSSYTSTWYCLGGSSLVVGLNARLVGTGTTPSIGGSFRKANLTPVAGATVGLFFSGTNGTRGEWIRDVTTATDGSFHFNNVLDSCYVVTFIAPPGQLFPNGTAYSSTTNLCPVQAQAITNITATLA